MTEKESTEQNLPPKPIEPDPSECCGRGCENCVYIYYERALERWHDKMKAIQEKTK